MKRKFLTLGCCILGLGSTTLFAQRGNIAAGGNATGTGGTVSYSIGQIFYSSPSGTANKLVQGLQQPYEISILNGIDEEKQAANSMTASLFPNPAINDLVLKIENGSSKKLSCALYTIRGELLLSKEVVADETRIEVGNLASADYILRVLDGSKEIKTFKITKYY